VSAWRLRIFVDSPLDSYNIEGMSNRLHKVIVVGVLLILVLGHRLPKLARSLRDL